MTIKKSSIWETQIILNNEDRSTYTNTEYCSPMNWTTGKEVWPLLEDRECSRPVNVWGPSDGGLQVWGAPSPNMNTEYYLAFINHRIPNIEYYLVLRKPKCRRLNTIRYWEKSKYLIRIVLFGLTIQIRNTKYRMVNKILEKRQLKSTYMSDTRHLKNKKIKNYSDRYFDQYSNTRILIMVQKKEYQI